MKLIDKDKIIAEIEKRIKELQDLFKEDDKKLDSFQKTAIHLCIDECKVVLNILDTIETKDVDLEKEFYDFLDTLIGKDNGHLSEDELFRIAEYFFELGLNTQKGE